MPNYITDSESGLTYTEITNDEYHMSGDMLLSAINKEKKRLGGRAGQYIHLVMGSELLTINSNAIVFLGNRDPYFYNNLFFKKSLPIAKNFIYDSIFLKDSSVVGHWDGESIFELIKTFQVLAKEHQLTSLIEIVEFCPTVLQSLRIEEKEFKSAKVGVEWSKYHPYFIDKNGLALVAFCAKNSFHHPLGVNENLESLNEIKFCLVSEANVLPVLKQMHSIKNRDFDFDLDIDLLTDSSQFSFIDIDTDVDHIRNQIKPKKVIRTGFVEYNLTAPQFKKLIDYHCRLDFNFCNSLAYTSGISIARLCGLFDQCVKDLYIDSYEEKPIKMGCCTVIKSAREMQLFESNIAANALMMKTNLKRMDRRKIEQQIKTVEARYLEAFNAPDYFLIKPVALGYFGSVLDTNKKDYGDLDVFFVSGLFLSSQVTESIDLHSSMQQAWDLYNRLRQERLMGNFPIKAPILNNSEGINSYSQRVLYKLLKRGSRLISIHNHDEIRSFCDKIEIHYVLGKKLASPLTSWEALDNMLLQNK